MTAGAGSALGVDVGGTKILGVRLGPDGTVAAEIRRPTPALSGGRPSASDLADAVAAVAAEVGAGAPEAPLGLGVPGMVDRSGTLVFSPHLPAASGARLGPMVAERLGGRAVAVENDANCAAVAEQHLGAAAGADPVLVVTLGTGIGGGLLSGGRLVTGARGFAGEIGHLTIDPDGPPCPCGRRGCWERFASGSGLALLAARAAAEGRLSLPHAVTSIASPRPEEVAAAAARGDSGAREVVDELGWWVAVGLANLVAVLDPSRVVIGGGLSDLGELLLAPVRRALDQQVEGGRRRPAVEVVGAALGERASAVGAALVARGGVA